MLTGIITRTISLITGAHIVPGIRILTGTITTIHITAIITILTILIIIMVGIIIIMAGLMVAM